MSQIKTRHADYQKLKGNLGFGRKASIKSIEAVTSASAVALSQYLQSNQEYLTNAEMETLRCSLVNLQTSLRFIRLVTNK